ncbi:unnamed protein product, partial [Urochloa humidicola]
EEKKKCEEDLRELCDQLSMRFLGLKLESIFLNGSEPHSHTYPGNTIRKSSKIIASSECVSGMY